MSKIPDVRDTTISENLMKNIDPSVLVSNKEVVPPAKKDISDEELEDDYKFSRDKYRDLIRKADGAIDAAIDLALESEHPRAFEVVSQMLKNSSDITGELLKLQKTRKDIKIKEELKSAGSQGGGNTTNNAIFVGSTADLQKVLKDTLSGKTDTKESKSQIAAKSPINVEAIQKDS